MRKIDGDGKTIRELLDNSKYSIDYYQREYKWGKKQVQELINDLTQRFLEDYEVGHERSEVENYGHYFLGSIIISQRNGKEFIIDGQQRLTTITLLLMFLNNKQKSSPEKVSINNLIFSEKYGKKSFNLQIEERIPCMDALFHQQEFIKDGHNESVNNIIDRYSDIESMFPEEIDEQALPYFLDWLLENVHLIKITAFSDDDAYTIFETMNDRGLSLSPTDMLRGYLLANITDEDKRRRASDLMKTLFQRMMENGQNETSDFFKAWLRSQYAESIRERKRNASPGDFDRLGTEFHRWIRENDKKHIGLESSDQYYHFIEKDLKRFGDLYLRVRDASINLQEPYEDLFYIAQIGFTLQYPVVLAPLTTSDSEKIVSKKIRMVAAYLDILLARRMWNWRSISYSTLQYSMFKLMREIRGKKIEQLADWLKNKLNEEEERFITNDGFRLNQMNRPYIHWLLARMTDYIGTSCGQESRINEYLNLSNGKNIDKFEVEHIWANHYERHLDEFNHPEEFNEARNRIGGLLLLPKSFNASFGDLSYSKKSPHYFGQNYLAKTLDSRCYQNNPKFKHFYEQKRLPFKPYNKFTLTELRERQHLYQEIAESLWNPERISNILSEPLDDKLLKEDV